jgi:hypothetical protein
MNHQLKARLAGIRSILLAHHKAGSLLPSASKGSERETLVREFLEKVFPLPFRFGSGAISDAAGLASGQLDIVVEWPFCASFPTPGGSERLYLAESVAFVIGVKSDLAGQWSQVEESVAKVWPLRRRWRGHFTVDSEVGISTVPASESRIPYAVVGFSGYKTSDVLAHRLSETPQERRPDVALVIESGAYVGWNGINVADDEGLFAFCSDGAYFVRNVITADPDLAMYLGNQHTG